MQSRATHADLLKNLFYELFQTERSAERHSLREAERLGGAPPARALVAVAEHASGMKQSLHDLAVKCDFTPTFAGKAIGDMFSELRERLADHVISLERSYRMTLIGLRHGVDVVTSIRAVARVAGQPEIERWCTQWLAMREPLVEAVAAELDWFARRPARALEPARSPSIGLGLHRGESEARR